MSIDYGERERQFLETLKADSGRTLDEWLAAIAAQGLTGRNDIIDWLRRQGFMFSKASWIERIHNNSGKPIYDGATSQNARPRPRNAVAARPAPPVVPEAPRADPEPAPVPPPPPRLPPSPLPSASPVPPAEAPASDPAALDALLARAKAYRPLAVYLIAEIRKVVPDIVVAARDGYVVFHSREKDFALLTVSAKELRLGLTMREHPADVPLEAAKFPALRGAPPATHMTALSDARQITPALMAAVARAAAP